MKGPRASAVIPMSFFALAYVFSWAMWVPAALVSSGRLWLPLPAIALLAIGAFGPSIAAFILTTFHEGRVGAWQLLERGFDFHLRLALLVFIVVVPVSITAIAFMAAGGGHAVIDPASLLVSFFLFFFFGGSFGEEFGWRGYALPRLLNRMAALPASLILGGVWALWHLPLFWVPGTTQNSTPFWLFFIFTVAFSVVFTWLHRSSNGNLFGALLLHTIFNLTVVIFPPTLINGLDRSMVYTTLMFVLLAVSLTMLRPSQKPNLDNASSG